MRIAWISAGVSSFIAAYISQPDKVIYIDVANQHPDSLRFIFECQNYLDAPIEILRDTKYAGSIDNVINDVKYINGVGGAACTRLLKKRIRQEYERTIDEIPVYIWGYDFDEKKRAQRLADSSEFACEFPLIENHLTKKDCHAMLQTLGIKRPEMYELGYSNNNCIGCVKGGKGYWNKIRIDFPEVFKRRAKQERLLNHSCIKGVFLDELDPTAGNANTEIMPECSIACLPFVGE